MSLPTPSPPLPRPPPWLIEGGAVGHEAAWLLGWPQSLSGPPGAQARALGQPAMRAWGRVLPPQAPAILALDALVKRPRGQPSCHLRPMPRTLSDSCPVEPREIVKRPFMPLSFEGLCEALAKPNPPNPRSPPGSQPSTRIFLLLGCCLLAPRLPPRPHHLHRQLQPLSLPTWCPLPQTLWSCACG